LTRRVELQNTSTPFTLNLLLDICLVFPTRVFPNPKPGFLAIFYYPKPGFFQLSNPGIFKNLELLLHSNISNSDNTEVADWRV